MLPIFGPTLPWLILEPWQLGGQGQNPGLEGNPFDKEEGCVFHA